MADAKLRAEWFWTDRWFASSAYFLPIDARGLYRELLTRAWSLGGELPDNLPMIQRMVAVTDEEWAKAWPLVEPYWKRENGKLFNETQREIMGISAGRRLAQQEKGKKRAANALRGSSGQFKPTRQANKPAQPAGEPAGEPAESQPGDQPENQPSNQPPSPSLSLSLRGLKETLCPVGTGPSTAEQIRAVFDHFRSHGHDRARLGEARKKLIAARLKDGYTVEDLKLAIDGLHLCKWHLETDNLTLEYGIRNAEKIEKLQGIASDERHKDRIKPTKSDSNGFPPGHPAYGLSPGATREFVVSGKPLTLILRPDTQDLMWRRKGEEQWRPMDSGTMAEIRRSSNSSGQNGPRLPSSSTGAG